MYAAGLQLIPVTADKVVLKRGVNELLLTGPAVELVVEPLVRMLHEGKTREQIIDSFAGNLQAEVQDLIKKMLHRRLIAERADLPSQNGHQAVSLQSSFWWNFGELGKVAPSRLETANVLVIGSNLVSRSIVRSLLEMKLGHLSVARHPILDNYLVPSEASPGNGSSVALRYQDELPSDNEIERSSLLCATCDFGSPEAMLEMNRTALRFHKPFLPVWISEMIGYIGPLGYPFETACLRCYQVRTDSNNRSFEAARAVRRHLPADPDARYSAGFLPPMAGVAGEIAAMEIVKFLTQFVPADSIGRIIVVNLVSFASTVRRVLKIPRCPDCSQVMQQASRAVTAGPLIPTE